MPKTSAKDFALLRCRINPTCLLVDGDKSIAYVPSSRGKSSLVCDSLNASLHASLEVSQQCLTSSQQAEADATWLRPHTLWPDDHLALWLLHEDERGSDEGALPHKVNGVLHKGLEQAHSCWQPTGAAGQPDCHCGPVPHMWVVGLCQESHNPRALHSTSSRSATDSNDMTNLCYSAAAAPG